MDELEKLKEITRHLQEMRKELDKLDDYYQRRALVPTCLVPTCLAPTCLVPACAEIIK